MALAIQRRFTRAGESPYAAIEFRLASSEIRSPDGSVVFRLDRLEAPSSWSQVAIDVLAQKYLRKVEVSISPAVYSKLTSVQHLIFAGPNLNYRRQKDRENGASFHQIHFQSGNN